MLTYFNGSGKSTGGKKESGFTLMELIIVIIIMGVMSAGIAGFIKLSTQTYLNVTERDELLANARFAVERLNREIRNAVPNSVREDTNVTITTRCLEFVPIVTSTVYTDIAVAPDPERNILTVIPFKISDTVDYNCNDCGDVVMVYPLDEDDIYQAHDDTSGKAFEIEHYPATNASEIELKQVAAFAENSPTNRAYIFNTAVSYCLNGDMLTRYVGYDFAAAQSLPPSTGSIGSSSLMAEGLDFSGSSFTVTEASLQRNAVVQIKLNFTRGDEEVLFDNAIHITNIP